MDEHRVGLKPIVRRVWAPRGEPAIAHVDPRYDWTYVYGFVCPCTGATFWLVLPRVDLAVMALALRAFAAAVGAGRDRRIVLVLDGAGWHQPAQLAVPDGLHLVFLPPYSPELQPAERLWPLTDEPLLNRTFTDVDALSDVLAERCRVLATQTDRVAALTGFWWWKNAAA